MKNQINCFLQQKNNITTKNKIDFNTYISDNSSISVVKLSNYITPFQVKYTKKIQIENGYQCSILDYGSQIKVISQTNNKNPKVLSTIKGITLDQTMKNISRQQRNSFKISIVLNKTERYRGQCQVIVKNGTILILSFLLQINKSCFNVQYQIQTLRQNFLQYINTDPLQPNLLKIILKNNRNKFMEFLSALKIYCHFGNWLKVYFEDQYQVNCFLYNILKKIDNPLITQIQQKCIMNNLQDQYCNSPPTNDQEANFQKRIMKLVSFKKNIYEKSQIKVLQIRQSFKKIRKQTNNLIQKNNELKKKLSKNNKKFVVKQKIKDFKIKLKNMTSRIQNLQQNKTLRTLKSKIHSIIKFQDQNIPQKRPKSTKSQPQLFIKGLQKGSSMRKKSQSSQNMIPHKQKFIKQYNIIKSASTKQISPKSTQNRDNKISREIACGLLKL